MSRLEFVLVALLSASLVACAGSGQSRISSKRPQDSPDQNAAELQVKMGRGYLEQGEYETAHQKLERALELDPVSVDAHTLMAVLFERIERPQFAEKHYRRAVELDPDDGSTNNNIGTYLCRQGRFPEADGFFKKALNDPFYKTPGAAAANAGVCATRAGNYASAEAYFRKSLEVNPKDPAALFEMALVNFRKSDFLRARAFMQRYESVGHADASALDLAAQIEERLGDAAAAAKYRERLKAEFPDYEPGTVSRGSNSP